MGRPNPIPIIACKAGPAAPVPQQTSSDVAVSSGYLLMSCFFTRSLSFHMSLSGGPTN